MEPQSLSQAAIQLTRGQLLDLLLEIEDRLKMLIRGVFVREREDWERLIPESLRVELGASPSAAAASIEPSADLLDRANLKQLIDLVLARWKYFDPILADKAWVQATLNEVREARNSLAHGAQPKADDKVRIALMAASVSKRLPLLTEATPPQPVKAGPHLFGSRVLWIDDRPEGNTWPRQFLRSLGADVVPVLTNDEAIYEATQTRFDVAVSDIDRGAGESGAQLGVRLTAAGFLIPIVFYISVVDPTLPTPVGGVLVTNDRAAMLTCVLSILRPDAVRSS